MNPLARSLAGLRATLKRAAGSKIRIRRNGIESDVITAVKAGATADQFDDTGAFVSRVRQIDWLIEPADYVIADEAVEPLDDDLIEEVTVDDDGEVTAVLGTYVVSSPNTGTNPWRYTDAEETMFRVHVNED